MLIEEFSEEYTDIRYVSELHGLILCTKDLVTRRTYYARQSNAGRSVYIMEYDVAGLTAEAHGHLALHLRTLERTGEALGQSDASGLARYGKVADYKNAGFIYQEVEYGRTLSDEILTRRCTGSCFSEAEVWGILTELVKALTSLRGLGALDTPPVFTTDSILLRNSDGSGSPFTLFVKDYMGTQVLTLPYVLSNNVFYQFSFPELQSAFLDGQPSDRRLDEALVWNIGALLLSVMLLSTHVSMSNPSAFFNILTDRGFSSQLVSLVIRCLKQESGRHETFEDISALARLKVAAYAPNPARPYIHMDGDTVLMEAAANNDASSVDENIHLAGLQNNLGQTALMLAAERGHLEVVKLLAPRELRLKDKNGMTALMHAAAAGRHEVVAYILAVGTQLNMTETGIFDLNNNCALMHSIICNCEPCVQLLAPEEVNAYIPATDSETILTWAVRRKEAMLLSILAEVAARNPAPSFGRGRTALMIAVLTFYNAAIDKLLFQAREQDSSGRTALIYAVLENNAAAVERLAPHEGGMRDERGEMAIIKAMKADDVSLVRTLAPYEGACYSVDGLTPLMLAAKSANRATFDALLELTISALAADGSNILDYVLRTGNVVYRRLVLSYIKEHKIPLRPSRREPTCVIEKKTQLMAAVEENRVDLMEHYIDQAGCLLSGFVSKGNGTALMIAINNRNLECAALLVQREACIQTQQGLTALMRAAEMDYTAGVKLLVDYECMLQDWNGWTALMWAASKNNISSVKLLLCEQSLKNKAGKTALQIAQLAEQTAAISILKEA